MAITKQRTVELIRSRLQIKRNDTAASNTALGVQPAGLRLQFLNRFHAGTGLQRISRNTGRRRCAIHGVFLSEKLTAIDYCGVGIADW